MCVCVLPWKVYVEYTLLLALRTIEALRLQSHKILKFIIGFCTLRTHGIGLPVPVLPCFLDIYLC